MSKPTYSEPATTKSLRAFGFSEQGLFNVSRAWLKALRPHQWVKNTLLFAGLIFSKNVLNVELLIITLLAFANFCMLTSGLYLINDLLDINKDRHHPTKCKRPIASGQLPLGIAVATAILFELCAIGLGFLLDPVYGSLCLTYFVLNLFYCLVLKHIVIIDVFVLATDFVIRAVAGAAVIHVTVSHWLVLCTFLLSLFMGFGKRRQELILLKDQASNHRKSLEEYSSYFLDQMIAIVTGATIVCYALYTLSEETVAKFGTQNLIYTVPFVVYGIFRYLYLVYQRNQGGSPTKTLLKDISMQINIVLWLLVILSVLYIPALR